jgi:hypothetical protein
VWRRVVCEDYLPQQLGDFRECWPPTYHITRHHISQYGNLIALLCLCKVVFWGSLTDLQIHTVSKKFVSALTLPWRIFLLSMLLYEHLSVFILFRHFMSHVPPRFATCCTLLPEFVRHTRHLHWRFTPPCRRSEANPISWCIRTIGGTNVSLQ